VEKLKNHIKDIVKEMMNELTDNSSGVQEFIAYIEKDDKALKHILSAFPQFQNIKDVKEYIKEIGYDDWKELENELEDYKRSLNEEGSTTAGVGGYLSPKAFAKKGQKINAATATAKKQGMKTTSGMPKNSKMLDYKELWPGKKSAMNEEKDSFTHDGHEYKVGDTIKYKGFGYTITYINDVIVKLKSNATGKEIMVNYSQLKENKKTTGSGRRFIPTEFEFPSFLLKPITVGNEEPRIYFKIVSKDGESVLLIDPLIATALGAIERGRTSFNKQQYLSALTKLLSDRVPANVRGMIKKYSIGADIQSNGFMALPLRMTKRKTSNLSMGNTIVRMNDRGINVLKAIKADPSKADGFENELQFLVYLYKNKETTPAEYAKKIGISTNMASRIANTLAKQEAVDADTTQSSEEEGDTWYIINPYSAGLASGINTPIYEELMNAVKGKLLNEVSYNKFKKDVSYRSKTEMLHRGIKEVKKKLQEINRIVEYTSRMKQELSEGEGVQYWTRTEAQLQQVAEMVNNLNEKINKLK